jgi:hypothetical protein
VEGCTCTPRRRAKSYGKLSRCKARRSVHLENSGSFIHALALAENVRRMFHRWLSAARSARHRRMILQGKEDEIKAARLAVSWDRWRERFVNEKLRPIVSLPIFHQRL